MIQGLVYDNVFLAVKLLGDTDLTHFCFLEFVRLYHHICMRGIRDEEFSVFVCLGEINNIASSKVTSNNIGIVFD